MITTFKRRINRIVEYLKNDECILFYIDRIYDDINMLHYIKSEIIPIIDKYYKYPHTIKYVIPFTNNKYNDFDTKLYFQKDKLEVFLLKTTMINNLKNETIVQGKKGTSLLDTDNNDLKIKWRQLLRNIGFL
jgi:hypothetical protein